VLVGAATGGGFACAVLFASYGVMHGAATSGALGTSVAVAGLGGVAAAWLAGWMIGRSLATIWRRLLVSAMAAMGSVLLLVATTLADLLAGRWGLAGLGVLCLAAIAAGYRLMPRS
jgi:hypothetical protein